MNGALFQLANTAMSVMSGGVLTEDAPAHEGSTNWGWVHTIIDSVKTILWPVLALVGTAGIIYAIYLGVNLAKADSADKREEAKKRMINAIIGLASIIVLILLMELFLYTILPLWFPESGS